MPPDDEAAFIAELLRHLARVVAAIEHHDGDRGTAALKAMLDLIVAHRDTRPQDAALVRALSRLGDRP